MKRIATMVSFFALCMLLMAVAGATAASDSGGSKSADYVPGEILIQYEPGATAAQKADARGRAAATHVSTIVRGNSHSGSLELARIPAGTSVSSAIGNIKRATAVDFAEPNFVYTYDATSNDPYFTNGSLWGMYGDLSSPANTNGSQAAEAWSAGVTGSSDVYVGVIDEGIQYTHPDLDANVWVNPYDPIDGLDNDGNGYKDDLRGWDFVRNDNSIYDGGKGGNADTHGTHVSGTIGAERNGAGVVGLNWNVKLISGKFLGKGGGSTANAIRAVDYFTDLKTRHGLNIVATNNSWGGGGYSQALKDAIERANTAGILFVAAAGNGGTDGIGDDIDSALSYPAAYDNSNVIAVAAITSAGGLTTYSNYGDTHVDLGAPGNGIYSTLPLNKYGSYSGTSMATPHVTGAVALYASNHAGASGAQIKAAILGNTIATSSLSGKTVTGGRLDAAAAVLAP